MMLTWSSTNHQCWKSSPKHAYSFCSPKDVFLSSTFCHGFRGCWIWKREGIIDVVFFKWFLICWPVMFYLPYVKDRIPHGSHSSGIPAVKALRYHIISMPFWTHRWWLIPMFPRWWISHCRSISPDFVVPLLHTHRYRSIMNCGSYSHLESPHLMRRNYIIRSP